MNRRAEARYPALNDNGNGASDGDDCGPSCGCASGSEDRIRQIQRAPETELEEVEA